MTICSSFQLFDWCLWNISRPQVNLKQDVCQSFSEKISIEVDKIPAQSITTVLPPVPSNSFQLESDFRQLKSSPDMLYQYLKVRKKKLVVLSKRSKNFCHYIIKCYICFSYNMIVENALIPFLMYLSPWLDHFKYLQPGNLWK